MRTAEMRHIVTRNMQRLCWFYLTSNFRIASLDELSHYEPKIPCVLHPITPSNFARVLEFRERSRVEEYREKIERGELGFFAESGGRMVGSIWATINHRSRSAVIRNHIRLLPNQALIHDIVTGEGCKGMGVGPFMVAGITPELLGQQQVSSIVIDVNRGNQPSLRMMEKVGLKVKEQVLYISVLGRFVFEKTLRREQPCAG
jgi:RimJ/RimL family protein N-acetyltransferase